MIIIIRRTKEKRMKKQTKKGNKKREKLKKGIKYKAKYKEKKCPPNRERVFGNLWENLIWFTRICFKNKKLFKKKGVSYLSGEVKSSVRDIDIDTDKATYNNTFVCRKRN